MQCLTSNIYSPTSKLLSHQAEKSLMEKVVKTEPLIKDETPPAPTTPSDLRYLDEFANLPEVLPDRQPEEEYETRETVPSPEIEQVLDETQVEAELEKDNLDNLGSPEVANASGDASRVEVSGEKNPPPNSSTPFVQLEEQQPAAPELGGMGKGRGKRVYGADEFFTVASIPPPQLTEKAIDSRLRRVFKPRADGTMLVDESWRQQWADKEGRIKVLEMFEKVGYNTDRVPKMVVLQDFGNHLKKCFQGIVYQVDPLANNKDIREWYTTLNPPWTRRK